MPSDESIEQHQKKRAEETEDVERDRNGPNGLFKGAFPPQNRDLVFDEQDGVFRCPRCLTEHEGGPNCTHCLLPVDNEYFSDDDQFDNDIDAEDLEFDMDSELAGPYHHHFGHFIGIPHFGLHHFPHHHHHHHHHGESVTSNSEDEDDFSGTEDDEDEEDDEDNSLQDFIVRDEEEVYVNPDFENGLRRRQRAPATSEPYDNANNANPITISDDDSDEGGAVSARRPRRGPLGTRNARLGRPSVIELSSSEAGDLSEDATMLRNAGWSPLSQGNDSEAEVSEEHYGYEDGDDDEGDTETVGNRASDDDDGEDDRSRSELSETPRTHYFYGEATSSHASGDYDSEGGTPSAIDRDGDTEMSASPRASRTSRSPSINAGAEYGYERGENLGVTTQVYNLDGDSDDSIIRLAPRRHRPRAQRNVGMSQYDPRISMIFAEHQQNIRGVQDYHTGLRELDGETQRVEPASRSRRTNAYRYRPHPRRGDPLRAPTFPSVDRVVSSSVRAVRPPRQYLVRS
jgi:hypothetical protein